MLSQPKVNQRLCSWRSNFRSTAIALVTNFLAASKADEDDEDEDDTSDFEQVLATNLLEDYAFLYEDPETRDPDQIYRSIFMLEMIEAAHINAIAGFLDVPALNTHGLHLNGMQAVIAACAAAVGPISRFWLLLMVRFYSSNVPFLSLQNQKPLLTTKALLPAVQRAAVSLAKCP